MSAIEAGTGSGFTEGLEGIVVAETVLAKVDGEAGRLVIRGADVETLAGRVPFEAVCGLLWTGDLITDPLQLRRELGEARAEAFGLLPSLGDALDQPDGMDALRAALSHLRRTDERDPERERVRITGALAVFAAAWGREQLLGRAATPPDPTRGHAEDLLRMLLGGAAPPAATRALDTYLATVAEHGMCASTFTARVVASTESDSVSAIVAAIGALKGPLHGGAPGPVLDMLDAIGEPSRARAWLEAEIDAGRRIMGMGHRVYRVRDPRAAVLEGGVEALESAQVAGDRLALARAVEREAAALLRERVPGRALEANVEFYTAVLLDAVGLDRRLFTLTFAVARVAGWLAHVEEQRRSGRIIRPRCHYVGPIPDAA